MIASFVVGRAALALALALPIVCAATGARADAAAANTCATKLTKDGKAIFDATLPQVAPGANLKDLVTTNTRSLAMGGTIGRGDARSNAEAAAKCLQLAN